MSNYIAMNDIFMDKNTEWVLATLSSLTYDEISRKGIVLWCDENVEGKWTMLGGNKFAFEDAGDAMTFKLRFCS